MITTILVAVLAFNLEYYWIGGIATAVALFQLVNFGFKLGQSCK